MTWRERARPIIIAVLEETRGQPEAVIRKALTAAYPFGNRAMYPYDAWLAEVRFQRFGLKNKTTPIEEGQLTLEALALNGDGD